jgi:two-component sensor histidine kinase
LRKPDCESHIDLLAHELNHRIRNLLAMVEAAIRQTESTDVNDYRAKLMARIAGLRGAHELRVLPGGGTLRLAELLEQAMHANCAKGARLVAGGPEVDLTPRLMSALELVFHELAMNASKYGALSSPSGLVKVSWDIRQLPCDVRKLAISWTEHGGPEVSPPRHRGFGSRLIMRALQEFGEVRVEFNAAGVACYMVLGLDRAPQSLGSA